MTEPKLQKFFQIFIFTADIFIEVLALGSKWYVIENGKKGELTNKEK